MACKPKPSRARKSGARRVDSLGTQDSVDYSAVRDEITVEVEIEDEARWELQQLFDFWGNPENHELIVNAVPLDVIPSSGVNAAGVVLREKSTSPEKDDVFRPVLKRLIKRPVWGGGGMMMPGHVPTGGSSGGPSRITGVTGMTSKQYKFEMESTHGKEISEASLKDFPYNQIGKVFWVIPDNPKRDVGAYSATAFYIGDNTVMTSAHNFKNPDERVRKRIAGRTPVFVPAMTDKNDIQGKNYSIFVLDDVYIHTKYVRCESFMSQYDICIAKIIPATVGTRPLTGPGLQLMDNSEIRDGEFNVSGYRWSSGKMVEFSGTFSMKLVECLHVEPAAYKCMSGGLWIRGNGEVVGIQSAVTHDKAKTPSYSCTSIFVRQNFERDRYSEADL